MVVTKSRKCQQASEREPVLSFHCCDSFSLFSYIPVLWISKCDHFSRNVVDIAQVIGLIFKGRSLRMRQIPCLEK